MNAAEDILSNRSPQLLYLSFDTVPAPKGSAIHIEAFVKSLALVFAPLHLITVSPTAEQIHSPDRWPGVDHWELPALGATVINRALHFRTLLQAWLQDRYFEVIHFRSIFEGFKIACEKEKYCRSLIFEVNGLPSIELKYRYPRMVEDPVLMHKLIAQEQVCLEAADRIITPSPVTAQYLQSRGVTPDRITVIPNGVDLDRFTYPPPRRERSSVMGLAYFGTLSSWQGIELAIRAVAGLIPDLPVELRLIGPGQQRQKRSLQRLARKLQVSDRVKWLGPLSQFDLVAQLHQADGILAPLTINDRNLVQGCCPLKVLEGMAVGVPVISTDLPVVRDLGHHEQHFLLAKPGSVPALQEAILRLHQDPTLGITLSRQARQQIEDRFTWDRAGRQLVSLYRESLQIPSRT